MSVMKPCSEMALQCGEDATQCAEHPTALYRQDGMREPRTKLPPISWNTVMLGPVCHPSDNTWQKGVKHSRSLWHP